MILTYVLTEPGYILICEVKRKKKKNPDITNLATNTTLNDKINQIEKDVHSITNLAITTAINAEINEVKNKMHNITNLATMTAPTAVENRITNVSNLVKKNWL